MTDWIALSDRDDLSPAAPKVLDQGLFVLEYRLPILQPQVLLQFQASHPFPRSLAVFFDPATGISLLHRQGTVLRRHRLPGPIAQRQGIGRLTFRFDVPNAAWSLTHGVLGAGPEGSQTARGNMVLPLTMEDFHALCTGAQGSLRHADVLWFGLTQGAGIPERAGWMGMNTPIETRRGPVLAGLLRPGDMIATLDDGYRPLLSVTRRRFPSRGSFAPVILRSPYFAETTDLLVAADQLVLISGASVEYLFGDDEALVSAGALADGRVAIKDDRRALTDAVSLDLGGAFTLIADGCCLVSAHASDALLPRRSLKDYETLPLLTLLGRISLRHVA